MLYHGLSSFAALRISGRKLFPSILNALLMDCHPEHSEGSQVVSYSLPLYALHCQLDLILALNHENARTYFQLKCGSAGNSLIKKLLTLAKRLLCTAWLYASRQDW